MLDDDEGVKDVDADKDEEELDAETATLLSDAGAFFIGSASTAL